MSNPFAGMMGNMPGPMGNMAQMVQQFKQFRQTFQGNPQEKVQELLKSGKISQEQLNQAQQMAQHFQQFLK